MERTDPSGETVLMLLPRRDFDPTEVAVSWQVLTQRGFSVKFATPEGAPSEADPIMLTGHGLDPWGYFRWLSRLPLLGMLLRANRRAREAYRAMLSDEAFQVPVRWGDVQPARYAALVLPGGHRARGMREYLESQVLQQIVVAFFRADKPVGAICHGVLLAARSIDPQTGRSVLHGRKTTALTWALEAAGARLGRIGRFWDPHYYRTYLEQGDEPAGFMSVQQEVTRALADPDQFLDVPRSTPHFVRKTLGLLRDKPDDRRAAWVVQDDNYISARWPGDTFSFANSLADAIEATEQRARKSAPKQPLNRAAGA